MAHIFSIACQEIPSFEKVIFILRISLLVSLISGYTDDTSDRCCYDRAAS